MTTAVAVVERPLLYKLRKKRRKYPVGNTCQTPSRRLRGEGGGVRTTNIPRSTIRIRQPGGKRGFKGSNLYEQSTRNKSSPLEGERRLESNKNSSPEWKDTVLSGSGEVATVLIEFRWLLSRGTIGGKGTFRTKDGAWLLAHLAGK